MSVSNSFPTTPFIWPVTVSEKDIDPQEHASNVAVVAWMNRAAWEHSKSLGYDTPDYRRLGGMFVVRRHEIDYHASAYLGDKLACYTWPSGASKARAERRHRIIRPADGALIAEGLNHWAYLDTTTGRPTRIPTQLRAAFDPARFV